MKNSKVVLTVLILVTALKGLYAQGGNEQAMELLKAMSAAYQQASQLAFDVRYRYAAEDAPGMYLDSLEGHIKMSGNRYWYILDSTETIQTADYVIMLFKQDKILYLARPSAAAAANNALTAAANPISSLENYFSNNKNITCRVEDAGDRQRVIIEFNVPVVYKNVEYYIDKKTGYLLKMVSRVRAEQLYDAAVRPQIEGGAAWAIVETLYSNYRRADVDDTIFDSSRYFRKEGKEYVTVAPYEDYKVFLGSVGL